jgi:hypothetical protein
MITATERAKPVSMRPFAVFRLRMHASQLSVWAIRSMILEQLCFNN